MIIVAIDGGGDDVDLLSADDQRLLRHDEMMQRASCGDGMSTNTFYELLLQPHEDPPQTELAIIGGRCVCGGREQRANERKQKKAKEQKSGSKKDL